MHSKGGCGGEASSKEEQVRKNSKKENNGKQGRIEGIVEWERKWKVEKNKNDKKWSEEVRVW